MGRASIHASTITGGDQLPVYPATCTVGVERCLIPGETWRGAEDEMRRMLARARAVDPAVDLSLRTIVGRDPIAVDPDELVAQSLLAAFEAELGYRPVVRGEIGWMDSGILFESGVPCATFGPTGGKSTPEPSGSTSARSRSVRACSSGRRARSAGSAEQERDPQAGRGAKRSEPAQVGNVVLGTSRRPRTALRGRGSVQLEQGFPSASAAARGAIPRVHAQACDRLIRSRYMSAFPGHTSHPVPTVGFVAMQLSLDARRARNDVLDRFLAIDWSFPTRNPIQF